MIDPNPVSTAIAAAAAAAEGNICYLPPTSSCRKDIFSIRITDDIAAAAAATTIVDSTERYKI